VNREEFESSVLDLWMSTRIPLSRAHIQYHTGLARQRLNRWLDDLTAEGVLEVEVDDDGEMVWIVPGAERSLTGPKTFAEMGRGRGAGAGATPRRRDEPRARKRASDDDDDIAALGKMALTLARKGGVPARDADDGRPHKSLAVSAGLSLLGPPGWLYAGSLREAAIGTVIALVAYQIVPWALLLPLMYLVLPLSVVAGLIYAWQYNRKGERTTLFLDGKKDKDDKA
jgi:hypothetical protein